MQNNARTLPRMEASLDFDHSKCCEGPRIRAQLSAATGLALPKNFQPRAINLSRTPPAALFISTTPCLRSLPTLIPRLLLEPLPSLPLHPCWLHPPRTRASASSFLVFCLHHHFYACPRLTSDPYLQRPLTTSPHPRSNLPASLVLPFFQLCRTLTPQHLPSRSSHLLSPTSHPRLPRQTPPPHASLIPFLQQPLPPRQQQLLQPS